MLKMPSLSPSFNYGSEIKNVNGTLYNQLNDSYTATANIVNGKVSRHVATTDPSSNAQVNANFSLLDIWGNTITNRAWIMTSRTTATNVTWTLIT